jgi:hypothetical protein
VKNGLFQLPILQTISRFVSISDDKTPPHWRATLAGMKMTGPGTATRPGKESAMTQTPRWMTAVLRESQLDLHVLPWQRGYRSADRSPVPAAKPSASAAQTLREIA